MGIASEGFRHLQRGLRGNSIGQSTIIVQGAWFGPEQCSLMLLHAPGSIENTLLQVE